MVKVRCKLCGMQLVHRGGTTSLASHLSTNHMEEYTRSFGSRASSKKQTTLPTIVRKCSAECAATITRLIAKFVARELRPLSIVCGDSFRQLLNTIEPGCLRTLTSPRFVDKSSRRRRRGYVKHSKTRPMLR